ncbi:hypothetical protein SETIT_2G338400v2 [Setaria italica]|uniref:Uncharacterized protein n=1 Tax=Setaria italica TaxID=4555 RepID=K4A0U9_SETIT|nr:hypothetical protein SETIT_2G338400v2 [Setaria italica]
MSTARPAQNSRPAVQSERDARPVDERVQRLLEAYRPWEVLDGMALTIIDQTYAALVEILGLDAPPTGGGPVKASHLLEPPDDADSPGLLPVLVVVEASATHCSVRLIDGGGGGPDHARPHAALMKAASRQRQHGVNRRAIANASPGMIHLARAAAAVGGGDDDEGGEGADRWKKAVGDVQLDVSEKALLGVLDAMRAHMDTAIWLEDGVMTMARAGGCRSRIRATDIIKVRMTLGQMRRELDLSAVMRRFRRHRCMMQNFNRRRPAAEMDVDQVDEEDVLTKRLKGLHVMENTSSEATHGEQGNNAKYPL